jgi:ketosteroid isomerase-like protein
MDQPGQAIEVIHDVYDAIARGDIPGLFALLDDDVEWRAPESTAMGRQIQRSRWCSGIPRQGD